MGTPKIQIKISFNLSRGEDFCGSVFTSGHALYIARKLNISKTFRK